MIRFKEGEEYVWEFWDMKKYMGLGKLCSSSSVGESILLELLEYNY